MNKNIVPIFAETSWIAQSSYEGHSADSKDIIKYIKSRADIEDHETHMVAPHIKHGLIESASSLDLFNTKEKVIVDLHKYLEAEIFDIFVSLMTRKGREFKIDSRAEIVESWYHITSNGGYHDTHTHEHTSFAGIYFISVKECGPKNGAIRFYQPFRIPRIFLGRDVDDIGLKWTDPESLDFDPEDGDIIIWPGFIPHMAIPYFGKSDRIVIAFNARILEYYKNGNYTRPPRKL
jgi:uncharacterized protein (TIGR02466 family)